MFTKPKSQSINAANFESPKKISKPASKSTNASLNPSPLSNNRYSVTYEIFPPENPRQELAYNRAIVYDRMQRLLEDLHKFNYEFTIRNAEIPMEDYLSEIMLDNKSNPSHLCHEYNEFLRNNAAPAHNNFRQTVYLTLTTFAGSPAEADQAFTSIHDTLYSDLNALYGYQPRRLTAEERQHLLDSILHPNNMPQSSVKHLQSTNSANFESPERNSRLAAKSTNAPQKEPSRFFSGRTSKSINASKIRTLDKNSLQLGLTYARTFFLNCIPANCVDTIFHDITAISPNSLLSIHYEPVDLKTNNPANEGGEMKKGVGGIEEKVHPEGTGKIKKDRREEDCILKKTSSGILASFVICLFAESREDLDRDTKLLQLSTAKYHCRCLPLDFAQEAGLRTALPLGLVDTRVIRAFSPARLSRLLPLNVQSLFSFRPVCHGINQINGNLVMLDRTNACLGLIAGVDHSGKTTAIKREATTAILTTPDPVYILTPKAEEYQKFAAETGVNLLDLTEAVLQYEKDPDYGLDRGFDAMEVLFQRAINAVKMPEGWKSAEFKQPLSENVSFGSENFLAESLIRTLDFLWNESIRARKANKSLQIFVDGIDTLFQSPATSDYLLALLDNFVRLQIQVTMVIQHSAHIVADPDACLELDYFLQKVTYAKLFTQGPVERKKYIEAFNIPSALVSYITDQPPASGLIITPTANIPFKAR